jgi:hypothetical protein
MGSMARLHLFKCRSKHCLRSNYGKTDIKNHTPFSFVHSKIALVSRKFVDHEQKYLTKEA